jgi:hypothetical protein
MTSRSGDFAPNASELSGDAWFPAFRRRGREVSEFRAILLDMKAAEA